MLKRWSKNQPVSARRLNAMQDAIPNLVGGSGIRIARTPAGVHLRSVAVDPKPKIKFDAMILNATPSTSGPNRWDYQFGEVIKRQAGYGGWQLRVNGRTGDAYNRIEIPNSAIGVQGNGIDLANLPTGFSLQPIATGIVVEMSVVRWVDTDNGVVINAGVEYWFSEYNGVDGDCDGGGV